jgi:hypothetical protein
MSTQETSGQPDQASGENQETGTPSGSEGFVKRESFMKALAEKKSAQAKLNEAMAQLKQIEEEKLSQTNQFQELAQKKSKEAEEYKAKLEQQSKTFAYKVFEKEAKNKALEMGANPKALDALIKSGDWSDVEINFETFEVNQEHLSSAIARMQKENDFFFAKSARPPKDVQPSNGSPVGKKPQEMSTDELIKAIKSLS